MSGMTKRRNLLSEAATFAIRGTLTLNVTSKAPLSLYPITPSLYIRTFEPPKIGVIGAFWVAEAAKRCKASIGEGVHSDFLFIKAIVAGPGSAYAISGATGYSSAVNGLCTCRHMMRKVESRPLGSLVDRWRQPKTLLSRPIPKRASTAGIFVQSKTAGSWARITG